MSIDKDGVNAGEPGSRGAQCAGDLGFTDEQQRRLADDLIAQCSGFTGLGEALSGRRAKAADVPAIGFEPGFVVFPRQALRDLAAGVAGRLGMALMGAATKLGKPAQSAFVNAARAPEDGGGAGQGAPRWPGGSAGGGAWGEGWDDAMEGSGSAGEPRRAARSIHPAIEEGEGSDSLDSIVTALEDNGFGDPGTAEIIKANRAKSKTTRRP